MLKNRLREFQASLLFFTRLPGPVIAGGPPALSQTAWAWPVAGAVVALLGAVGFALLGWLGVPPLLAAIAALFAMTIVTGALHEDGFADCADSLGASAAEERLRIMKDSRIGTYGAIAIALVFAVRIAGALVVLDIAASTFLFCLICLHTTSRAALPCIMALFPAAKSDGLAAQVGEIRSPAAYAGLLIAAVIVLFSASILGVQTSMALTAAAGVLAGSLAFAWLMKRRVGGYTGDTLGGAQIAGELVGWFALSSHLPA